MLTISILIFSLQHGIIILFLWRELQMELESNIPLTWKNSIWMPTSKKIYICIHWEVLPSTIKTQVTILDIADETLELPRNFLKM